MTDAMNEINIRKYANLMRELDLTGLEITEGNTMVRLERNGGMPASGSVPPIAVEDIPEEPVPASADSIPVLSPMVGVFYASPTENASPFVTVGDHVQKGDTLCIIEAMKLMNEITAEQDGVVTEICAGNGQVVDYGTVLFRLQN